MEHVIPLTEGGADTLSNRALACASCNLAKAIKTSGLDALTGTRAALFNPRTQIWGEHFQWAEDGDTLTGLTATGRTTVVALDMNSALRREARRFWLEIGLLP